MLQLGLKGAPTIHLHGAAPIISAEQANSIVAEIKRLVANAVRVTGAKALHLFIAVLPSSRFCSDTASMPLLPFNVMNGLVLVSMCQPVGSTDSNVYLSRVAELVFGQSDLLNSAPVTSTQRHLLDSSICLEPPRFRRVRRSNQNHCATQLRIPAFNLAH